MTEKKNILKNKYNIYVLANSILFLLMRCLNLIHFETNDDMGISDICSGISGIQDCHVIFCNGYALKFIMKLDKILQGINWHGVMLCFAVFTSVNMILYVFFCMKGRLGQAYAVAVSLIYMFAFTFYQNLQFTRASGICIIAGFLFIIYVCEKTESSDSADKIDIRSLPAYIPGILMVFAGSLIRFDTFYCITLIFGLIFLKIAIDFLKKRRYMRIAILAGVGMITAVLCFGLHFMNNNLYRAQDYSKWKKYDALRAELMDYGWPEYAENEDNYASLGISKTAYDNYVRWDFEDPDYINSETMSKIVSWKDYSVQNSEIDMQTGVKTVLPYLFGHIIPTFPTYDFFWLFAAQIFMLLLFGVRDKISLVLSYVSMLIVELVLSYMHRGGGARVDAGVFCSVVLLAFLCMGGSIRTGIKRWARNILLGLTGVCIIIFVVICGRNISSEIQLERSLEAKQGIARLVCEDKDNVYLTPTLDGISLTFDPFESFPVGYSSNYISYGGWSTKSPVKEKQKSLYNVSNMYRNIVGRDDAYLMVTDQDPQLKIDYYREHYGDDINGVLVRRIAGVYFYRIVHGEEVNIPDITECSDEAGLECDYEILDNEDGSRTLMGHAVVDGDNSFTQAVYIGIPDENGNYEYHSTIQIVSDENADLNNGKYSAFIYEAEQGELDNVNDNGLVIIYENNGNLKSHYISSL